MKDDGWGFTLFMIALVVLGFVINLGMRDNCIDAGGTWIMQSWVCVPSGR